MESILTSIKKLLGVPATDTSFDQDIIMHINTVLMILNQMGVGAEGFYIEDETSIWTDFISDMKKVQGVKTYVYLKVRLIFDPPSSSAVIESINRSISELEWRLNNAVETTE